MTHPADISDLAEIDQASYFIASIFLGRGQFDKSEQSTLAAARQVANQMQAHYRNGRGGMVYAILPNGRSVLVPNEYQPKEKMMSEDIPAFLKRDEPAAEPAPKKAKKAAAKKPAAKKAKVSKPISRGVLTDKGKKSLNKKAKAPKAAKKTSKGNGATRTPGGKRGAILEAAKRGEMPTPPDFSANTHKPHRGRLEEVVALAKAGDVKGLKAFKINPTSTSPKAIARYRDLAVTALEARA